MQCDIVGYFNTDFQSARIVKEYQESNLVQKRTNPANKIILPEYYYNIIFCFV